MIHNPLKHSCMLIIYLLPNILPPHRPPFRPSFHAPGILAKYDLRVTSPSGTSLYDLPAESEASFHLVPVETGNHKFCLTVNHAATGTR